MTNPTNLTWIQRMQALADTPEERILFLLGLILMAMTFDFILGSLGAKYNPSIVFRSKEGINGIVRKLASIALLAYCIPLSAVLPDVVGPTALLVLYFGYLMFELKSILENLDKLGINSDLFKSFINNFSKVQPEHQKVVVEIKEDVEKEE